MISVVSYPERGDYGDADYRGNCSGKLIKDLLLHYKPESVLDPMEGSGTTGDVCKELNIKYKGEDLKTGQNALFPPEDDSLYDFIFIHPPYWDIIKYSDKMLDLSKTMPYHEFATMLRTVLNNQSARVTDKGYMAVLIGDVRKGGKYYHILRDIWTIPNLEVDSLIIKVQHNVESDQTNYSEDIIRIMHEYCLIWRKA